MVSDDTDHTVFVAQALLSAPRSPDDFARSLAWRLRFWLLCLPAGIGFATLRSILRLWIGFPPHRSGVRSAGNGPSTRSAIIGAAIPEDEDRRRTYVTAATRFTHTDPTALELDVAVHDDVAALEGDGPGARSGYSPLTREMLHGRV